MRELTRELTREKERERENYIHRDREGNGSVDTGRGWWEEYGKGLLVEGEYSCITHISKN